MEIGHYLHSRALQAFQTPRVVQIMGDVQVPERVCYATHTLWKCKSIKIPKHEYLVIFRFSCTARWTYRDIFIR